MKNKKILISQPEPQDIEKSPFKSLISTHNCDLTFYKFFDIVGVTATQFRSTRIHISEHTAIIFNSKNSVDHFFRLAKELREPISDSMKYFCSSEAVALYLQNYIQYRKRKIFFGQQAFSDIIELMSKHRDEKILFPCSDEKQTDYFRQLDKAKFKYTKATMYTLVPRDLKQFSLTDYDVIALFSPIGVRSLIQNFPDVKDMNLTIAAFGSSTQAALNDAGIHLTIAAPTKAAPSMALAIENFLLGKKDDTIDKTSDKTKKVATRKSTTISDRAKKETTITDKTGTKRVKSVIADKTKYKQLQEERKAQAAARKALRKAAEMKVEGKEETKVEE